MSNVSNIIGLYDNYKTHLFHRLRFHESHMINRSISEKRDAYRCWNQYYPIFTYVNMIDEISHNGKYRKLTGAIRNHTESLKWVCRFLKRRLNDCVVQRTVNQRLFALPHGPEINNNFSPKAFMCISREHRRTRGAFRQYPFISVSIALK